MSMFVRQEQLIQAVLYHKSKQHKNCASFQEIRDYGEKLQLLCNQSNDKHLDAVIITHSLLDSIREYPDLFELVELDYVNYVKAVVIPSTDNLMIGLLPFELYSLIINTPLE